MNRPLVTIAVTCYNRAHRLPETLDAVFAQPYRPVEVLIVDDGSTDGTREVAARYSERVRYHYQDNQGVAVARTTAGRLARGEWITFQDDDDVMVGDRIGVLYEALAAHPRAVFALGDFAVIDGEDRPTGRRSRFDFGSGGDEPVLIEDAYAAVLWPRLSPGPPQCLFRRADGERVGWFDTRFFHACEDTDFFARLARLGPIVYVPQVINLCRGEGASLTSQPMPMTASRFLLLEKHLAGLGDTDPVLRRRLQWRLREVLKDLARLRRDGDRLPPQVPPERVCRALALLGPADRVAYHVWADVELPLRRILRTMLGRGTRERA